MTGAFVCVVGPSGAGKDTLIGQARATLGEDAGFHFVRRLVTRSANAFEDHDSLGEEEFASGVRSNAYALAWRAHGLGYAVPVAASLAVGRGAIAICNVSRGIIAEARRAFENVDVVLITASAATIAARLALRGRESVGAIAARRDREQSLAGSLSPDYTILNDGSPEAGGEKLVEVLRDIRGKAGAIEARSAVN